MCRLCIGWLCLFSGVFGDGVWVVILVMVCGLVMLLVVEGSYGVGGCGVFGWC